MKTTQTASFTLEAESASQARRFVQGRISLDSIRMAEAALLVTELVGHAVERSVGKGKVEVGCESNDVNVRVWVAVESRRDGHGLDRGFTRLLLDRVPRRWGCDQDRRSLSVWFELRAPGSVSIAPEVSDRDLLARLDSDPSAAEELVTRHQRLAESIARHYRGKGVPDSDLSQVAMMALFRAIQRYEPERGDLAPYAAKTISGELKRTLRDRGWSVRVPRSLQERSLEVSRTAQDLSQKLGRRPKADDIAQQLGVDAELVTEAMDVRRAYTSASIDGTETGEEPLGARLEEIDTRLQATPSRSSLESALAHLPERERRILHLRFFEDMTQTEIGKIVGLSQMHVSRLLKSSLENLREILDE